jgi:hypothetical protein
MADTSNHLANQIADAKLANKILGSNNRASRRMLDRARGSDENLHTLYLYSHDTVKRAIVRVDGTKSWPPRAKAGQTFLGNAKQRIDQQDGTAVYEQLEILGTRDVPAWITDHLVRQKICSYTSDSLGVKYSLCRKDKDREWIDFHGEADENDMLRIWNEAINDLLFGVRAPNNFSPYLYQQELVDNIVARFKAGAKDQLLAAIMRSGKCFISYEVARLMGFKKILVITGKTGVNEGWGELLPKGEDPHINYINWHYHNYNLLKKQGYSPSGKDVDVAFFSLQYFNKHLDALNNKNIPLPQLAADALSEEWDLVVFDEQHWGTQTQDTQYLLSAIKWKHKLELSGTAYKTLIQGRYDEQDVHSFDYVDEQNRRFNGTPEEQKALEFRPDINFALINIPGKIKEILNDEGFSLAKLLAVKKGQSTFKNVQNVSDFLNFIKTKVYGNKYDDHMSKFKPYISNINRHTLWILPNSIASAAALKNLLEGHPYFKDFYVILATAGNVTTIKEVKDTINDVDSGKYENKTKGTITLTCGRFLEGTTVPQWWCVHQINDDKSAADYFQGSFRTKSEDKANDKKHVIVYDYNPERFVQVVYDINLDNNRRKPGQTTGSLIREWREVSDVYDYSDNAWNVVTGDSIVEQANRDVKIHINSFNSVLIDKTKINTNLEMSVSSLDIKKQWIATTGVNNQGLETGPNQTVIDPNNNPKNNTTGNAPDQCEIAANKFKQAMGRIYDLIWSTVDREKIGCFDDICNYTDHEFVESTTGLSPAEWTMWRDSGAISNVEQINRRIDAINESLNV